MDPLRSEIKLYYYSTLAFEPISVSVSRSDHRFLFFVQIRYKLTVLILHVNCVLTSIFFFYKSVQYCIDVVAVVEINSIHFNSKISRVMNRVLQRLGLASP